MKSKRINAGEALKRLEADPEWRARRDAKIAAIREREELRIRAEEPLVAALAAAGVRVRSVWDLVNTRAQYPAAVVPVLLDHLCRPYPEDVLEGIARALAIPEAKVGWSTLLKLYLEAEEVAPNGLKTALACALSGAADDEVLDELAMLVKDKSQGESRIALLGNLAQSSRPDLHQLLRDAVEDPQLAREAKFLLRLLRRK